jgi:RimJ/RimL family protein N-acetyltransferase
MIETERLLLRLPEPEDADGVARFMADPEVMRYIGAGQTGTYDDAVERIELHRRKWERDGFGLFSVLRRDTGEFIGRVGLLAWDPVLWEPGTRHGIGNDAEIELGWTLDRTAWGHGYATEAAIAARDWALREVRPRRLISLIHPDNVRSIRVAERIGSGYERDIFTARGVIAQLWSLPSRP